MAGCTWKGLSGLKREEFFTEFPGETKGEDKKTARTRKQPEQERGRTLLRPETLVNARRIVNRGI